jgi:hypothetical protein
VSFEKTNDPDFDITEFDNIRMDAGTNSFVLSMKQLTGRQ